ncbi:MAG: nitroreductase family deazaflavin-dependent oxidoreductase [Candidatus Binatia bacterium]
MQAVFLLVLALVTDLSAIQEESTVRLVTIGRKSGAPRPVTIWFVADGGKVYVQAGKDGSTDWFKNLEKTPAVTLEFADRRLQGKASVVTEPAEAARIVDRFRKKYWLARLAWWVGSGIGAGRPVRIEILE